MKNNKIIQMNILSENSKELFISLNNSNINLFEHQRKILYYIYNFEKNSILKYKNLKLFKENNCQNSDEYIGKIINTLNNYNIELRKKNCNENDEFLKKQIICISDIAGSGKSYSALAIIKNTEDSIYETFKLYKNKNIIIVNDVLIDLWNEYLKKFKLNYICIKSEEKINTLKIENYDIILLSIKYIKKYYLKFKNILYLRCFVDEYFRICYLEDEIEILDGILINNSIFKYIIDTYNRRYDYFLKKKYFVNFNYIKTKDILVKKILNIPFPNFIKINLKLMNNTIQISKNDENMIKEFNISNYNNDNIIINKIFKNNIGINNIDNNSNINNIKDRILIQNCPMCREDILNKIILLCCNNVCCLTCFPKIQKCMICREEIKFSKFTSRDIIFKYQLKHLESLCVDTYSKILIIGNISDITSNLEKLSLTLFNKSVFKILNNSDNISEYIKNNSIKILYIDIISYYSIFGSNVEYITDIIFLNSLEHCLVETIVAKMQRIGRNKKLNVYTYAN